MNTTLPFSEEAIIGWAAFACSEIFPVITRELSKRGYGVQLNSVFDVFFFVVYTLFICGCINQATIWICETVFSRDIDGDGVKGKPKQHDERSLQSGDIGSGRSSEERNQEVEINSIRVSNDTTSGDSVVEHTSCTQKSGSRI
jgi:hypothetical protein